MHDESMDLMRKFRASMKILHKEFFDDLSDKILLDVGSQNINGTYRSIFTDVKKYTGIDTADGNGVDIVLYNPYKNTFDDGTFDIVISGQALEHMTHPWKAVIEMSRVLKEGGYICLIAPWAWYIHNRMPFDCWRILPDGMRILLEDAGIIVITIENNCRINIGYTVGDTMGIGHKKKL
jgi:SAM-dependent methyltransferase